MHDFQQNKNLQVCYYKSIKWNSFRKKKCWHIIKKLDLITMKKGAKKLIGTKDFSTFRASSCRARVQSKR